VDEPNDQPLSESELTAAGPIIESDASVVIPKKGKVFEEDGTCRIAIIRPCVSNGKRIRGLPPIYTPAMLAENAAVFTGWRMFGDHMTEGLAEELIEKLAEGGFKLDPLVEAVRKRSRSIWDLGGRLVKTHYDPEFTTREDDSRGFRPGAVIGRVLPQPPIRAMLEADPEILRTSINAWPRSARPGAAPWAPATRGMIIEGIRSKPEGSVDWVVRDGAGGHVLKEDVELAVSLLESYYDAARGNGDEMTDELKTMTPEQLREKLEADRPDVLEALGITPRSKQTPAAPAPASAPAPAASAPTLTLTEEELTARIEAATSKVKEDLTGQIDGIDDLVEERASELIRERGEAEQLEEFAHGLIKGAGLPSGWTNDLLRRYSVLPSGPSPALLVEAETDKEGNEKSAKDVLAESIKADIRHAVELIQESGGRPRVRGLGADAPDANGDSKPKRPAQKPAWETALGLSVKEGEKEDDVITEMLREGASA
jgi:hypothetical protein